MWMKMLFLLMVVEKTGHRQKTDEPILNSN